MKFAAPVMLVGNGPVDAGVFEITRPFCGHAVAADGGAKSALSHGLSLAATIGDMDSTEMESAPEAYGKIIQISEQNSTDFEKCLSIIKAPLILGVGFLGGRLDHELAALNTIIKAEQNIVLIGEEDLVFRLPEIAELTLPLGTRISTFPMGDVEGVTTRGLAWPLDGLSFAPHKAISTSNQTVAAEITIMNPGQPLLCILPRVHLAATLKLFNS